MGQAPQNYSNIPIPDPSVVTQQSIDKAKEELRREIDGKVSGSERVTTTRLDSMDKASVVLAENVNRVPTLLDRESLRIIETIKRSEELSTEKFTSLSRQIGERDIRTEQDKRTGETAIAAAFQAQKEAAAKSEILTTKLIDGQQAIIIQIQRTVDDKLAVINGRLDRGEGGDRAHSSSQTTMIAMAGVAAIVLGIVVGYFAHPPPAVYTGREPIWAAPIPVTPAPPK